MNGKLWFKAKQYGWGWYPATWQGWAVLCFYIVALAGNAHFVDFTPATIPPSACAFLLNVAVLTIFLLIVCYATGEEPRWRWPVLRSRGEAGGDKNTNKTEEHGK